MESVSCVTPGEAQEERLDERQKIFRLLRCFAKEERDIRPAGSSFKEHRGTQFVFSAKSLHFNVGIYEPLFCSVALYDWNASSRSCKKISEDFHFDLNDDSHLSYLGPQYLVNLDPVCRTTAALFSVVNAHPDIYAVVRIEKVLYRRDNRMIDMCRCCRVMQMKH